MLGKIDVGQVWEWDLNGFTAVKDIIMLITKTALSNLFFLN